DQPLHFNPARSDVCLISAQDKHVVSAMACVFPVFFGVADPDISPIITIRAVDAYQSGIGKKPVGGVSSDFFVISDVRVPVVEQAMTLGQAQQTADDALLLVPRHRPAGLAIFVIDSIVRMDEMITRLRLTTARQAFLRAPDIPGDKGCLGALLTFVYIS